MKIGIIGAGRIGQALAKRLVPHGHEIMLSNSRGLEAVREIAEACGCAPGSAEDAAQFGDIVVVTVPLNRLNDLPVKAIGDKIVIDTCNYYPNRDGERAEFESGPETTSGSLQKLLSGARVVKAFNSIMAPQLADGGTATPSGGRHALPIASDDAEAADVVAEIVRDTGLEPVYAGTLNESWKFERARPAYCRPMDADALRATLAATQKGDFVPEGSWRA